MVTDSEEVKRFSFPGTAAHLKFLRSPNFSIAPNHHKYHRPLNVNPHCYCGNREIFVTSLPQVGPSQTGKSSLQDTRPPFFDI
jgi:hypothetical protein